MSHHFDSAADRADGRINPCDRYAFPAAFGTTTLILTVAQRAGADIVEVEGSHVIMISQPQAVTDHILKAARAVAGSHR